MPSGPDLFPQEQVLILEALDNRLRAYYSELQEEKEAMAGYTRHGVTAIDGLGRVKYIKGEIERHLNLMQKLSQEGWKI